MARLHVHRDAVRGVPAKQVGAAALAALGLAVLVIWEGGQTQDSPAAHRSVLAVALGAVVLGGPLAALWRRRLAPLPSPRGAGAPAWRLGLVIWAGLVLALAGLDVGSLLAGSLDLPTLSDLAGRLTRHRWGRSLLFAAWLAAGAWPLLGRGRAPSPPTDGAGGSRGGGVP